MHWWKAFQRMLIFSSLVWVLCGCSGDGSELSVAPLNPVPIAQVVPSPSPAATPTSPLPASSPASGSSAPISTGSPAPEPSPGLAPSPVPESSGNNSPTPDFSPSSAPPLPTQSRPPLPRPDRPSPRPIGSPSPQPNPGSNPSPTPSSTQSPTPDPSPASSPSPTAEPSPGSEPDPSPLPTTDPDSEPTPSPYLSDEELDQLFPELPDDPGEAGKETLEGIDADGDGVRDDVQRYIFRVYAEDDLRRKAMLQYANSYQERLNIAHQRDPELSREKSLLTINDDRCAAAIFGDFDEYFYEVKILELAILNTRDRVEADLLASQNVGGQSFSSSLASQDLCRF